MKLPLAIFAAFLLANLIAFLGLLRNKSRGRSAYFRHQKIRKALGDAIFHKDLADLEVLVRRFPKTALLLWRDLQGTITVGPREDAPVRRAFQASGIEGKLLASLRSPVSIRRYEAAQMIRPLVSAENLARLTAALRRERHEYIKLALVKDLVALGTAEAFDGIAASIAECSMEYFRSVRAMMESVGPRFIGWAHRHAGDESPGVMIIILSGAKSHRTKWLKEYIRKRLDHDDPRVRSTAIGTAEEVYPDLLIPAAEQGTDDIITRRASVRVIAQTSFPLDLERYSRFFSDPVLQDVALASFASYISAYPEEIGRVVDFINTAENLEARRAFSLSVAGRLPFLLVTGDDPWRYYPIAEDMIEAGRSAGLIAFLNTNRDPALKDVVVDWVRPFLESNASFRRDCARYLDETIREELGIAPHEEARSARKIPLTKADRAGLAGILVLVIALPAAAMLLNLTSATIGRTWILAREIFRLFSWGFGFYAVALNCIYLMLIILARRNLKTQARYWSLLDKEYLFTPGIIPSISILAPAYNEEKTVIQSVHSLLTLEYPDYQVIVINDGSADDTIGVLKREFELERIDLVLNGSIPTAPIRGIYRSPRNAKLLVVDKENGGKADALNSGINLADREYICSIDSDSLLEPDALLRMTAQILTTDTEVIAVGGNILPVNGCTVERGMLQNIALSENRVARLQTIEYLRSFIAGRLGWAQINALLIISGAFGLFRRSRVLEIGGYMTGRGEFMRDTVGEDMELVVRLVRRMREARRKCKIRYAASANCWTEVPEDLKSLYKQRDRWHRGLVEIMTWHRKMIFNPRYGTAGLIAFPYFVIFEFIGPFYEFAGYPLMLIGFATGALHWHIFIILFSAILLFGLLISMISLVLSERDIVYFRRKELATLLGHSIIENFGFRQLMGWVRVFSLVGMLLKNKGWQKLERKGFTVTPARSAAKA